VAFGPFEFAQKTPDGGVSAGYAAQATYGQKAHIPGVLIAGDLLEGRYDGRALIGEKLEA
jgi:hypothetical protein